ncbi:CLUMA_CG012769, isoform A [Clunio marinus]|uniref:CLUMA_CG012769, isoform A n=1 Tax=Clunio marinus TaxID=568069 RepID=A0A1J1IG77_9DIPT|nr:CLUMA_CG012769, isoform A [Clunio marinus]
MKFQNLKSWLGTSLKHLKAVKTVFNCKGDILKNFGAQKTQAVKSLESNFLSASEAFESRFGKSWEDKLLLVLDNFSSCQEIYFYYQLKSRLKTIQQKVLKCCFVFKFLIALTKYLNISQLFLRFRVRSCLKIKNSMPA